jgi:hypothetical protein
MDISSVDGRPPGSSGKSQPEAYSSFVEKKDPHAHLFLLWDKYVASGKGQEY